MIGTQIIGYKLLHLTKANEIVHDLVDAFLHMILGVAPLGWVWLFRKATPRDLGFRRGHWSIAKGTGIAAVTGMCCGNAFLALEGKIVSIVITIILILRTIVITPGSPALLALWVLAPVSEEILDRGFLYAYLRPRIGVTLGLLLQAAICGVCHWTKLDQYPTMFVMALVFGLLYELSGSLYPSIICHSLYNMTVVAITAASKLGL